MPVLLFVHGTGVRGASYFQTLELVSTQAKKYLPNYTVKGVQWGDERGAQLYMKGASVPNYDDTGGDAIPALTDADLARWYPLSRDPLLEIRLQPPQQTLGKKPGETLWQKVTLQLDKDEATTKLLTDWNLNQPFSEWIAAISASEQWKTVISGITQLAMGEKVARAVTAGFQIWLREEGIPGLTGAQRDQLKKALTATLGGALGVKDLFFDGLSTLVTPKARRRRGEMADATSPAVGDILLYQARGEEIQNRLADAIKTEGATAVLAHSLGGVACTDLFIQQSLPVTHFITAGSQAPYFYELNALCSLEYQDHQKLPNSFPKNWLNLYDHNDFLSFCGRKVFPGQIEDCAVNNGQPFPESHSGYWRNEKDVWPAIRDFLPK